MELDPLNWINEKEKEEVFLPTKMDIKEGIEKDMNNIRTSLNKISIKNYDIQKDIIISLLIQFLTDDIEHQISLKKIAQFIFDIASTNKFYSALYVDLYLELINKSSILKKYCIVF